MLTLLGVQNWISDTMFKKFKDALGLDSVETVACNVDDMVDGEMRQIDLGEGKALLVRDKGEYFAIGPRCSHYGAPLHKGAYCNGRVRCPWHGACFNVKTGDIEDFPGMDSIPKFEVRIHKGQVMVSAKKPEVENTRRTKPMTKLDVGNDQVYVVVGGGAAGSSCVETLRQESFAGRVILICKEPHLPYDRPKLSKMLDAKPENLALRKPEDYKAFCVETMSDKQVTGIDTKAKNLKFANGESLHYDKVLFATGGSPRKLDIAGENLKNVRMLRSVEDANYLAQSCKGQKVVVIGTSFIGLEVAAYMLDKGEAESVTIVGRSEVPLKHVLGEKIGNLVKALFEGRGAKFVFRNPPAEFVGESDTLSGVRLQDGTVLEANLCVIGAGVSPSTFYLADSGVDVDSGYVKVDKHMCSSVDGVYAAGDITKFPLFMADNELANIQHWQMATQQGRIAGLNMADKPTDINSVPFFWTMILGKGIRYAGYGSGYDDVIIHGSLEEYKFVAYYVKGDKVVAVATMGSDPVAAQAAEMFSNKIPFLKQDILNDAAMPPAWTQKLTQFSADK